MANEDHITLGHARMLAEKIDKRVDDVEKTVKQNDEENDTDLSEHTTNKSNPHSVTKAQVGLGKVDNTSDADKPVSTAQATAIADAKKAGTDSSASLNSHTSNKSNPHSVTKEQIGLGNVPNVATNDQTPTYTAATTLATLTSGEKLSISMGKIMKAISDFISHKGNMSNPHSVNKSQLGLGNVENKSASTILGEMTKAQVVKALGYTPPVTAGNNYTHPSYTARTGVPTTDAAPAFGGTFNVSQPVSDATGHIIGINSRKITIPNTEATEKLAGLMSPGDKATVNTIQTELLSQIALENMMNGTEYNVKKWLDERYAPKNTLIVIWTNESPNKEFPPTTFTQATDSKFIVVSFRRSTSNGRLNYVIFRNGTDIIDGFVMNVNGTSISFARRQLSYNANGTFAFGDCYTEGSANPDNSLCIPYEIYGIG